MGSSIDGQFYFNDSVSTDKTEDCDKTLLGDLLVNLLVDIAETSMTGEELAGKVTTFLLSQDVDLTDPDMTLLLSNLQGDDVVSSDVSLEKSRQVYDPKSVLSAGNMHPDFVAKIDGLMQQALKSGLDVQLFRGYRSIEQQDALYNSGRGVTNAKGGSSYHNYGLAVDVVFSNDSGGPSWDQKHDWATLGEIGKSLGLTWGGDFRRLKDLGHFEYHPGKNLSDVQTVYQDKGLDGVLGFEF